MHVDGQPPNAVHWLSTHAGWHCGSGEFVGVHVGVTDGVEVRLGVCDGVAPLEPVRDGDGVNVFVTLDVTVTDRVTDGVTVGVRLSVRVREMVLETRGGQQRVERSITSNAHGTFAPRAAPVTPPRTASCSRARAVCVPGYDLLVATVKMVMALRGDAAARLMAAAKVVNSYRYQTSLGRVAFCDRCKSRFSST